jgi:putative flippase GtrA
LIDSKTAWQFGKFIVVGLANTLLSFAIYATLVHFGVYYVIAQVIAFLIGAVQSYLVNRYWTFSLPGFSVATLVRYLTVQLFVLALSTVLLIAVVESLGMNKLAAQAVVLPFVSVTNFILIRTWALAPASSAPASTAPASTAPASKAPVRRTAP